MSESPQKKKQDAIKFQISNTSKKNTKYTLYTLKMQTQLTTWETDRRYSDFLNLHIQISKKHKHLPKFPPKKINSMKDQVIEERKIALANYMNELLQFFNIFADKDVSNFIQMKDQEFMRTYFKNLYEYQEGIMKDRYHKYSDVSDKSGNGNEDPNFKSPVKPNQSSGLTQSMPSQSKIQSAVECEQKVLDFLEALEKDQDKFSINVKSFEEYFFTQKPILHLNYIKRLFFGDGYRIRGLLQHIKDLEPQTISSVNLINFVARLLDCRRNHQLDLFKQIFVSCEKKFIIELKLERHIANPSCKDSALYIIHEYLQTNMMDPSHLLLNEEILAQYQRWKNQRQVKKQMPTSVSPIRFEDMPSKNKKSFVFDMHPKKNKSTFDLQLLNEAKQQQHEDLDSNQDIEMSEANRLKLVKQKSHGVVFRSQLDLQKFSKFKKQQYNNEEEDNQSLDMQKMDDDEESSDEENIKVQIQNIGDRKGFNLRKITADFNSYQIENEKLKKEELKQQSNNGSEQMFDMKNVAQYDAKIKELIQTNCKKVSRIFSVQFHKIVSNEILNKIVNFKFEQSGDDKSSGISVTKLRRWLNENIQKEIVYGNFKIISRQYLGEKHRIIEVEYHNDEFYNTYPLMLSYLEFDQQAFVAIFPYDEIDFGVSSKQFIIVTQNMRKESFQSTQDSTYSGQLLQTSQPQLHKRSADFVTSPRSPLVSDVSDVNQMQSNNSLHGNSKDKADECASNNESTQKTQIEIQTFGNVQVIIKIQDDAYLLKQLLTVLSNLEQQSILQKA